MPDWLGDTGLVIVNQDTGRRADAGESLGAGELSFLPVGHATPPSLSSQ